MKRTCPTHTLMNDSFGSLASCDMNQGDAIIPSTPSFGLLAMQCSASSIFTSDSTRDIYFDPDETHDQEKQQSEHVKSRMSLSDPRSLCTPDRDPSIPSLPSAPPMVTPPGSPNWADLIFKTPLRPHQQQEQHHRHKISDTNLHSSSGTLLLTTPRKSPLSIRPLPSQITVGKIRFADGRYFRGKHLKGHLIHGIMIYPDGTTYEGGWVDGQRHGTAVCIFADGSRYEGDFKEGHFHGTGQLMWSDGGHYVGEFNQGEMDGKGMEVRADGTLRHDGMWKHGVPIRNSNDGATSGSDEPSQRTNVASLHPMDLLRM